MGGTLEGEEDLVIIIGAWGGVTGCGILCCDVLILVILRLAGLWKRKVSD